MLLLELIIFLAASVAQDEPKQEKPKLALH